MHHALLDHGNEILRLPSELLALVSKLLTNKDIKNLRLVNQHLADRVALRLEHVFISPNEKNIEVLLAVTNHPILSLGVREIVWAIHLYRSTSQMKNQIPMYHLNCGLIVAGLNSIDIANCLSKAGLACLLTHISQMKV